MLSKNKLYGEDFTFLKGKKNKIFKNPLNIYSKLKLNENDIICDMGGFIGEYSIYAISVGKVKKVYVYEPTPASFEVLSLNCKDKPIECYNKAVVADNRETINLYLSSGIGCTNSIKKIKKNYISVPCIKYEDAIKDATILKIDIEGGEYDFSVPQLLSNKKLRGIIIEFHKVGTDWKEKATGIMKELESEGYKALHIPSFNNGWDLTCAYEL